MKKYLFGMFAIALAVSFSAFTSARTAQYYWFDAADNSFLGSSATIQTNPLGCEVNADIDCSYGYLSETPLEERPVSGTFVTVKFEE
jgi:hypothetical protein